jgi:hypothetical protein
VAAVAALTNARGADGGEPITQPVVPVPED